MLSWFACFDVKSFVKVCKGLSMCSIPDFGLSEGKSRRRQDLTMSGRQVVNKSLDHLTRHLTRSIGTGLMRYCLAFPIKPCQVAARAVMQAGHQCVATPTTATHMNFGSPFNQLSNFHCFQPNHFKYKQTGSNSKSPNLLVLL